MTGAPKTATKWKTQVFPGEGGGLGGPSGFGKRMVPSSLSARLRPAVHGAGGIQARGGWGGALAWRVQLALAELLLGC